MNNDLKNYAHKISMKLFNITLRNSFTTICFLSLLFQFNRVFSQTADPVQHAANILPPSPNASELGKYGLVPVGLSTGAMSTNIPLHTFTTKNLSLPISLSYSSNGIKVDQIATWVGMSWSLNAGGVITRIIKDEPDGGNQIPYPSNFSSTNAEALQYLQAAGDTGFDSEQDLFAFNFAGYTGRFLFDRTGMLVIMPHQNLKIERHLDELPQQGYFLVTTPDGIKYTFAFPEFSKTLNVGPGCGKTYDQAKETSWFLTKIEHPTGDIIQLEYAGLHSYQYAASVSQTVTRKIGESSACGGATAPCPSFDISLCQNVLVVSGGYLSRIWSSNFGEVEFIATRTRLDLDDYKLDMVKIKSPSGSVIKTFSFNYLYSTATAYLNNFSVGSLTRRMFLKEITENDKDSSPIKKHSFDYEDINGLPPRLSFSQDHWGYFNGAINSDLVPIDLSREDNMGRKLFEDIGGDREPHGAFSGKGMLNKITYPTGGYSQIVYESNNYRNGSFVVYPPPISIPLGVNGSGAHNKVSQTFQFLNLTTQEIKLEFVASLNPDAQVEVDPYHNFAIISFTDITANEIMVNHQSAVGESFHAYADLLAGHEYLIEISAFGSVVQAGFLTKYFADPSYTIETDSETGGVRVAQVKNFDPVTAKFELVNYKYSKLATPNISSGYVGNFPVYYNESTIRQACPTGDGPGNGGYGDCFFGALHSNSISNLYPANGNNVYYSHVTVSRGSNNEAGAEEHEFIVHFDSPGDQVWGQQDILSAPNTNFGWDNGLEKTTRYFKKSGNNLVLLRQIDNEYVTDDRINKEIKGVVARRKYDPILSYSLVINCDSQNRQEDYRKVTCITNHNHAWIIGGDPFNGLNLCQAVGAQNVSTAFAHHPCYGKGPEVTQITVPWALDYLDAIEYKNISYWFYLKSTTETVYDESGQNPMTVVKENFYDNPVHSQLSKVRTTTSDNKIVETSFKYLNDYSQSIENFSVLNQKYIINQPVKTENTVGSFLTEGKLIKLTDYGQPKEIFQYEAPVLQLPPSHDPALFIPSSNYKSKATLTYDPATKNLKELTSTSSPIISYKWGYNDSRVVAKIVGAGSDYVFYTSFEDNGTVGASQTGERYLNSGTYTISFVPSNPSGTMMSYWYWQNGKWNFSGEVAFTSTINQGSKLDEIRIYPKGAQLTTITYHSRLGTVTSVTDLNNVSTYYDYDDLSRLTTIQDQNRNTIKENKYHYVNNN
jgi:YD repeat-containing protein